MFQPLQALIDLVLPPRCPGCRVIVDGDGRFCADCWPQLQFISSPACACCGLPFEIDRGPGALCGQCLATPPRYTSARAALVYGGPARTVLLGLKHGDRQHLATMMARQMLRPGAEFLAPDVVLVPVPLHRWRLWRRGFNQAALLARAIAAASGAELAIDALERVKPTPPSQGMGRAARRLCPRPAPGRRAGRPCLDLCPGGAHDRRGVSPVGRQRRGWRRKPEHGTMTLGEKIMAKVEIYTKFLCPYCTRAKALLGAKGVAFEEYDISMGGPLRAEMLERAGGRNTVPQVFIDGRHIGGSDDLAALDRAGKLDPLLAA
jgi:GrxC family glutaredoxin